MRRQEGFSLVELLATIMIVGIAMGIAIPKMRGHGDNNLHRDAQNTLESAWEDAQEYYRGDRGSGQEETSSYDGFDGFNTTRAAQIDPKITWSATPGSFTPGNRARQVLIYQAANQSIALCAASPKGVLCKVDDGMSVSGRYGPRYGFSSSTTAQAISRSCAASPQAAAASTTTCALNDGSAGVPGDADGDGIADDSDACPAQAGTMPNGCADTDNDGIADTSDSCPSQAGPAPSGCPDTDSDGVPDGTDNCPNTPNPTQSNIDGDSQGDACDAAPNGVPQNNTLPAVSSNTVSVGGVLTASAGTWTYGGTLGYQWRRCNSSGAGCANIAGATSSTYTLKAADFNQTIRVQVTNSNADGPTTATSAPTAQITGVWYDDFSAATLNPGYGTVGTPSVSAGRLNLPCPQSGAGGILFNTGTLPSSDTMYNRTVEIDVAAMPSPTGAGANVGFSMIFVDAVTGTDYWGLGWQEGQLFGYSVVGGVAAYGSFVTFNPTSHRYLRVRHSAAAGRIYVESSPDRITWTDRYNVAVAPAKAASMILGAQCARSGAPAVTPMIIETLRVDPS